MDRRDTRDGVQPGSRTAPPPLGITARRPATTGPDGRHGDLNCELVGGGDQGYASHLGLEGVQLQRQRQRQRRTLPIACVPGLAAMAGLAVGQRSVRPLTPRRPVAAVLRG